MHAIRIDVSDTIYDKVMFFLQYLPKTDIKIYDTVNREKSHTDSLSHFFKSSPVKELSIERESEVYQSRVDF
jgi:hypothetical protein